MSQRYTKKTTRSRRKAPVRFRGQILGVKQATVQLQLPIAEILAGLHDSVEAVAAEAGLLVMKALIDDEVEQVAGGRYQHDAERSARRWGQEEGYVVFAGRKVPFQRPRVRDRRGREMALERYRLFQADGRMQQAVKPRVVAGVSMRDYGQVLDDVCDGYGVEKSSVSRHWKAASQEQLQQLLERSLQDIDVAAVLIDGIDFSEKLLVVALGIDTAGRKHVLGMWPGATENTTVCKELLADLVRRGLATDRPYLFVLDGAKALTKAVKATFGERTPIQRCQIHKERNVLEHLPLEYQGTVRQRLRAAWGMKGLAEARKALQAVVEYLRGLNPAAAASLEEGFEETLTVHRLGVPERLRRTLRSTNPIESCFSTTRKKCRNVKQWKSVEMVQRWAGTMLLESERRFRRIQGHQELPVLLSALRGSVAAEVAA
jgi:putative transposase